MNSFLKATLSKAILLTVLMAPSGALAQMSMRDVFKTLPDTIVPYLSENNRLDLLDFMDANMKAEVKNGLDGKSQLVTLNDYYADIFLNEAHRMELRLLDVTQPVDSCQQIICIVHTFGKDIKESTVSFHSLLWRKLPTANYVTLPDTMFVATLDSKQPVLSITSSDYQDRPAMEEQKLIETLPTNLKWQNNFFK